MILGFFNSVFKPVPSAWALTAAAAPTTACEVVILIKDLRKVRLEYQNKEIIPRKALFDMI